MAHSKQALKRYRQSEKKRVVNKTASCSNDKVAIASEPAKSALHKKVSGTTCGAQMPKGGPFLSTDEVNCIASWIETLPAPGAGGDAPPPNTGGGGGSGSGSGGGGW